MSVSFYLVRPIPFEILAPADYDPTGDADNPWSLNVSNTNAVMLLEMVGVPVPQDSDGDITGQIDEPALLELRCQEILHVLRADPDLDAGRATLVEGGDGCATFVRCGLRDGYLLDRISRLRQLAEEAMLRDAELHFA